MLFLHLEAATDANTRLITVCGHSTLAPAVSTPLHRPLRRVGTPGLPATSLHSVPATYLNIATFGWWEIICPTPKAVQTLCSQLAAQKVHVCCVTGFPAAVVHEVLDGSLGFTWVGDLHHDTKGSGLLVARPWRRVIQKIKPVGVDDRRRTFCTLPSGTLGVGVYGPCVGAISVAAHKE